MGIEPEDHQRLLSGPGRDQTSINLDLLARLAEPPDLYAGRDPIFWADPYVSEHVLNAYLDPDNDDASRRPEVTGPTVDFIVEMIRVHDANPDPTTRPRILDLGCGPGIYAERLAEAGCEVTGIDISPSSIEYARRRAGESGLPVSYVCGDFRAIGRDVTEGAGFGPLFEGPFDAVIQVYGEFCTLSDTERSELLERVRTVLKPGGLFLFDVFTERYVDRVRTCNDWYVSLDEGFWQPGKHAVLEQIFRYPADSASVVRYTIIDSGGHVRQFSVWWRHFTESEITDLVRAAGFSVTRLTGIPWGAPLDDEGEWLALVCRRMD